MNKIETQELMDERSWGKIFAAAWSEPEFKDAFEKDPASAVASRFGELPEFSGKLLLHLPEKPANLTDADLAEVEAGKAVAVPYTCMC